MNTQGKINFQPLLDWWYNLDNAWQQILRHNSETGNEITEVKDLVTTFFVALEECEDSALRKKMIKLVAVPKFTQKIEKWYGNTLNKRERKKFSTFLPNPLDEMQIREIQTIERLDCFDNKAIISMEPLKALKNLKYLDCKNTQISDLSPLTELKYLEEVCLNFTKVTSLEALEYLPNLKKIACKQSEVTKLEVERFKKKRPDCTVDDLAFL